MADVLAELANDTTTFEVVSDDEQASVGDVIELKESADEAPVVQAREHGPGRRDPPRAPPTCTGSRTRRSSASGSASTACCTRCCRRPSATSPRSSRGSRSWRASTSPSGALPQDGRIKLRYGPARDRLPRVDPAHHLRREGGAPHPRQGFAASSTSSTLGFDPWSLEKFTEAIHQPYGMVLITGPTGSGKTTHALLGHLTRSTRRTTTS